MLSPKEKRGMLFLDLPIVSTNNPNSILKYKIFLIGIITLSAILFQAGFIFPKMLEYFQPNYAITQSISLLFPTILGQILGICLLLPILKLVKMRKSPVFHQFEI
jgi:hypothetical protein